jgi:signal transduction histidine kinase
MSVQSPTQDSEQRLRDLEQAIRARDDFLAIAAHELRSPLHALALRLNVLERQAETQADPALREEIAKARRSAERYVRRAVVLLDVSRLTTGMLQPAFTRVDLRGLVDTVVEQYRDEANFHGSALTAEAPEEGYAHWDPHMAEEILANLTGNAIKYGHGSPVHLRAAIEGDGAVLSVRDGGPGIAAEDRARIFAKFERLVEGGAHRAGYGLGLWIVGRMVEAHGGTIEVVAPAGGGTEFIVRLPLRPQNLMEPGP